MSDSHPLRSQDVDPTRTPSEYTPSPRSDPHTLTLKDPLDTTFPLLPTLTDPSSKDIATLKLPTRTPTLTATATLLITPRPTRHITPLSDPHTDCSHAVRPTLTPKLYPALPYPAPCTDKLDDPVDPRFTARTTLNTPTSPDTATLKLPTRPITLRAPTRLPLTPDPTMHLADVSDSHAVCSHPLRPTRTRPVNDAAPKLPPAMLTTKDPVDITLTRRETLADATSTLSPCDKLPTRSPTLTETTRLPLDPDPLRHTKLVSDNHPLPSHPVRPKRTRPDPTRVPKLDPITLNDVDPVAPTFSRITALTAPTSAEYTTLKLPT